MGEKPSFGPDAMAEIDAAGGMPEVQAEDSGDFGPDGMAKIDADVAEMNAPAEEAASKKEAA